MGVERKNVATLGTAGGDRAWLASELMRPSDVSDDWQAALAGQGSRIKRALENVTLVEARDKNDEAAIISVMMRQSLEKPSGDMALVTPDRDLARRVKANLARWNIRVDDSAGEPLSRFSAPSLLLLLMDAVEENFSASSLRSLFSHHLSRFGFERAGFSAAARKVEVALFRSSPMIHGLEGLLPSFDLALKRIPKARPTRIPSLPTSAKTTGGRCATVLRALWRYWVRSRTLPSPHSRCISMA